MHQHLLRLVLAACLLLGGASESSALLGLGSAAPNQGTTAGGTVVDITALDAIVGTLLGVEFGTTPATNVQQVGLFTIRATAPAHVAGTVPVKVRIRIVVLGVNVDQLLTLSNGYTYVAPPTLSGVSPSFGPVAGGTVVTLTGANFRSGGPNASTPGGMIVRFDGTPATGVVTANATTLTAIAPAHAAGAVTVSVTNGENESASLVGGFTYQAAQSTPTLTAIAPASGPASGGTVIVLTGTQFAPNATVTVGGVPATNVLVGPQGTSLTATTPAHAAGPVSVTVTNGDGGTATLAGYTYSPLPSITAVNPANGPQSGGTTVTLTGTGFQAGLTATMCGLPAVVLSVGPTSVTLLTVPCVAGAVSILIANPDGGTTADVFTYVASSTPSIQSVTPSSGPPAGGTAIVIGGSGFVTGATVTVGCGAATGVVVTATSITAVTPACAAGSANVTVTNPDGGSTTLGGGFLFTNGAPSTPTLSGVSPSSGPTAGGTQTSISGTGFAAGAQVSFGGTPATGVVVVSGTLVTAITPAAAAAGSVAVTITNPDAGTASLPGGFTYAGAATPTIASIAPASGPTQGGTAFVLGGGGFVAGATVTFGGVAATAIAVPTDAQLTGVTPAHAAGTVDVVVTLPSGATTTLVGGFSYDNDSGSPDDTDGDGLPNDCETRYGLDPNSATGGDGASGDPDGDGLTNQQECDGGTHPRGFFRRYLAEGATGAFFDVEIALLNPGTLPSRTLVRYQTESGATPSEFLLMPPASRRTVLPEQLTALAQASFSTLIESDVPIVAERYMTWGEDHRGMHAEAAVAAPSTQWYFAEGATHGGFNLFYLLQNPNSTAVTVEIRYLRLAPKAPVVKSYTVAPFSRRTVWVDAEGAALEAEDLSAVIVASQPIVAERVMYMDSGNTSWKAGHAVVGVPAPAPTWMFSEGATGTFFHTFVLIANPNPAPVTVRATYLLYTGVSFTRDYVVGANSRRTVGVHADDPRLADTAFSVRLDTLAGEGVIAERAMWWPIERWIEGHASFGVNAAGIEWVAAGGTLAGHDGEETFVLIGNASGGPAQVQVRTIAEDGAEVLRQYTVGPNARFNVNVAAAIPALAGKRFGVIVTSLGTVPAPITVELSRYASPGGRTWDAGANLQATRVR